MPSNSTSDWLHRAEDALVAFVTSRHVKKLVIARVYRDNGVDIPRGYQLRSVGHLSNNAQDNLDAERTLHDIERQAGRNDDATTSRVILLGTVSGRAHRSSETRGEITFDTDADIDAEEVDPDREGGPRWIEHRALTLQVHAILRRRLAALPDNDQAVLEVFDQLTSNARFFDQWAHDPLNRSRMEDAFRGNTYQINSTALLTSLRFVCTTQKRAGTCQSFD